MQKLKFLSLFSGIGGFDLGLERAGMECVGHVEINPFCQRVLAHHWPHVKRVGDIRDVKSDTFGSVDLICGGFPCFVAGTQVLTKEEGYKPIEQIKRGELVLTKNGRYKPVNATMKKEDAPTLAVKYQGRYEPTVVTHEHPFWAKKRDKPRARKYEDRFTEAQWVNAGDLKKGDLIAFRCIEGKTRVKDWDFWYIVGRYLGDGWILDGKRTSKIPKGKRGSRVTSINHKVVICCDYPEASQLKERIEAAGYHATKSEEETTTKFIISSQEFTDFLKDFGRYAHGKRLPGYVYDLTDDLKAALFTGWLESDGYTTSSGLRKVTTVSHDLAVGMTQIAMDCFKLPCSISKKTPTREECIIEGRVVNERPHYCVTVASNNKFGYYEDGFLWTLVKKISESKKEIVYNIGVKDDETYTANGIVVHNCQPFSNAGKRRGKEDDRYLWPEMLRVIKTYRPTWIIGENVAGIVNMALDTVLSNLEKAGYECQSFIIPACAVDAPHRRDRVWIVGHSTGNGCTDGCTVAVGEIGEGEEGRMLQFTGTGDDVADSESEGLQGGSWDSEGEGREVLSGEQYDEDEMGSEVGCDGGSDGTEEGEIVADSTSLRWDSETQSELDGETGSGEQGCGSDDSSKDVANTDSNGTIGDQPTDGQGGGVVEDGRWLPEPNVGRVANGVPGRVDRLRSLGNAVVPQVVFEIGRAIVQAELYTRGELELPEEWKGERKKRVRTFSPSLFGDDEDEGEEE